MVLNVYGKSAKVYDHASSFTSSNLTTIEPQKQFYCQFIVVNKKLELEKIVLLIDESTSNQNS